MARMLVGYDLNTPGKDYSKLIGRLEKFATRWHCLDSTWIVSTTLTAVELRDELAGFMDRNDELLVVDITGDAAAWRGFATDCSKWLKDNL